MSPIPSSPPSNPWFMLGAGGQARVAIATARAAGLPDPEACLVDDGSEKREPAILGIPLRNPASLSGKPAGFFPAVGGNEIRRRLFNRFVEQGWKPISLIHPGATLEKGVVIGPGTIVALGALLQTGASIGSAVIINTGAIVEHDVRIGNFTHIAPGSILLGEVEVGEGVLVGGGSRILPRVRVHDGATVGAGSVVRDDVRAGTTVVGAPARPA